AGGDRRLLRRRRRRDARSSPTAPAAHHRGRTRVGRRARRGGGGGAQRVLRARARGRPDGGARASVRPRLGPRGMAPREQDLGGGPMRHAGLALLFALAFLGCAARPKPASPRTAEGPTEAPRVSPGGLEARPLLGDLPLRASKLGAGPLAIVASGPMAEGERLGAFVEVPRDACLLAYGRASASLEDIDL